MVFDRLKSKMFSATANYFIGVCLAAALLPAISIGSPVPQPVNIVWKPAVGQELPFSFHGKIFKGKDSPLEESQGFQSRKVIGIEGKIVNCLIERKEGLVLVNSTEDYSGSLSPDKSEELQFSDNGEPKNPTHFGDPWQTLVFPTKPVVIGGTWSYKTIANIQNATENSNILFTYKGTEKIGRFDAFKIDFVSQESMPGASSSHNGTFWIDSFDGSLVKKTDAYQYASEEKKYSGEEELVRLDLENPQPHKLVWAPKLNSESELPFRTWLGISSGKQIFLKGTLSEKIAKMAEGETQVALKTDLTQEVVNGVQGAAPGVSTTICTLGPRGQFISSDAPKESAEVVAERCLECFPVFPAQSIKYGDSWDYHYLADPKAGIIDETISYRYEGDEQLGHFFTHRISFMCVEARRGNQSAADGVIWLNSENGDLVQLDLREQYPSVTEPGAQVLQHSLYMRTGADPDR